MMSSQPLPRAIITSCSNTFFPSVINLLGSIKAHYPEHPPIFVYDLGLLPNFKTELRAIPGVTVADIPAFCPHWRSCYTWKTYIFAHPPAKLNLYLDAGCQVLKPLDEDFRLIEKNEWLLVDTGCAVADLIPEEYRIMFAIPEASWRETTFSAGIIGFKQTATSREVFARSYAAGVAGLTLGFSKNNAWRNKGKNKNPFTRNATHFRHDQTVINTMFRLTNENMPALRAHDVYSHEKKDHIPSQRIWHLRLSWRRLEYTRITDLHQKGSLVCWLNRVLIFGFVAVKNCKAALASAQGALK